MSEEKWESAKLLKKSDEEKFVQQPAAQILE